MSLKELAVSVGGIYVKAKTSAKRRQTALEALRETKKFMSENNNYYGSKLTKRKDGKYVLVPRKKTKPSTRREQLK